MKLTELIAQLRQERTALEKTTDELKELLGLTAAASSQNASPTAAGKPDLAHLECYKLCHDKLCSENELTNNRLSWNFTIQGFLFAAYALTLQTLGSLQVRYAENPAPGMPVLDKKYLHESIQTLHTFTNYLAWTGISVSLAIAVGAGAAQWAIRSIQTKFDKEHSEHQDLQANGRWKRHGTHFPGVTGGGDIRAHVLGSFPLVIPLIFAGIWIVALRLPIG